MGNIVNAGFNIINISGAQNKFIKNKHFLHTYFSSMILNMMGGTYQFHILVIFSNNNHIFFPVSKWKANQPIDVIGFKAPCKVLQAELHRQVISTLSNVF